MFKCNNPDYPEFHEMDCACMDCHPLWYCVDDPCQYCEGPVPEYCNAETVLKEIEEIMSAKAISFDEDD
jgi:hypothetical protein